MTDFPSWGGVLIDPSYLFLLLEPVFRRYERCIVDLNECNSLKEMMMREGTLDDMILIIHHRIQMRSVRETMG
ncbi:MAG: hypothetical protein ACFFDR_02575 [Candidatus Thorarchaeota archaeon]